MTVVAASLLFGWPVAPAAGQQTGRTEVPSGPLVAGLETFTGTGTQAQPSFSIGYFFGF